MLSSTVCIYRDTHMRVLQNVLSSVQILDVLEISYLCTVPTSNMMWF